MSVYVIIPFHSTDYAKWKELFDEFAATRDAWGAEGYVVYRGLDDPERSPSCTTSPTARARSASSATPSIRAAIAYWNAPKMPDVHVYEEVDRLF